MFIGIAVICTSLLYISLVSIIYSTKKKLNNMENKIYSFLLKISIFGLMVELGCCFFVYNNSVSEIFRILNVLVNRIFLLYMVIWFLTFNLYLFLISFFGNENIKEKIDLHRKKIARILIPITLIFSLLALVLPLYYFNDGNYVYSYGPATNVVFVLAGMTVIFGFYCLFKNIHHINKKKYYPLFALVLLIVLVMIIRSLNPGLIVINSAFAFVTVLMYFTIENPDVQMLGELYKAKEYAENSNNEKSIFLFKVTGRLREPLKKINRLSKEALMENDMEEIKVNLQDIKYESNTTLALVNDVLDISELENRKIPIGNHKYQPTNLFKGLATITKTKLKEKNIEFRFTYDGSVPSYLVGDSLRIKQILITILENAVKHTQSGFIEFNINSVMKHDICRLVIVVEDSGKGISADQLNHLFDKEKIDSIENHDIDDSQKNLVFVKTLIDLIGGTITVNSELGRGSKFMVVLDQKIPTEENNQVTEAVRQYENLYVNQNRILVVTSNDVITKKMSIILKKMNASYDIVKTGQECLEKIRNKENYQLIVMDEELPKLSSIHTFEKLKAISDFHIPVVLIIKNKDIETKDAYINIGFSDTINISINKEEVKKVVEKYVNK